MVDLGPDERALLESTGTELWEQVLASAGIDTNDPRIVEGGPYEVACRLLLELGLLTLDAPGQQYVAVDPAAVQSRVVAPLGQRGAQLLNESSQWAGVFAGLGQTWRRAPQPASGPYTEIRGKTAINAFIASLVSDLETEMLTAQPQTGRTAPSLEAATERDLAALERGVTIRTLYQHAARRSSFTHAYVAAVTERGGEIRTLDEFFNRLIVVDRRVAVIPSAEGTDAALVIREHSLVAYLVDVFERHWERARPFTSKDRDLMKSIAAEQRAMTIRMLVEGHSDPVSAKRLGVSPRTYAGYIADLKEEYQVQSRFQLGYEMGRLGVSGTDDDQTA
ncbi:TrmB family transcriptional regulator [Nocardioides sp. CFH 31398]|uniref:TrmB family transcriptional regulator n=1 Tax=Nocardioides sp. CFH 31398 TaxID=2919579 RepID=UPI001F05AC46|nr:LuxR family transcriptional regulator [Nocardioides sp. CFH 31398]MCH1865560.1 LuxR family transcriptional regulator [Nocardioides sp. CFH 31398]